MLMHREKPNVHVRTCLSCLATFMRYFPFVFFPKRPHLTFALNWLAEVSGNLQGIRAPSRSLPLIFCFAQLLSRPHTCVHLVVTIRQTSVMGMGIVSRQPVFLDFLGGAGFPGDEQDGIMPESASSRKL